MIKNRKQSKSPGTFEIEFEREDDGRWIVEVPELPGVMAYGTTKQEALNRAYAVALRTLADHAERGKVGATVSRLFKHGVARR